METISVFILGIVQGLTEFLPISSSAHLIIVPNLLNWQPVTNKLIFDVSLHFGSLFAVIFYFRKDWSLMLNSAIAKVKTPKISTNNTNDLNLLLKVLISTLPVIVIGFLFSDFIDARLRNTQIIAINLIIFGIVFYISDLIGKKNKQVKDLRISLVIIIGMFQVLALMPGVSRSAITITAALLVGLNRTEAARFSYLLAVPAIMAAAIYGLFQITTGNTYLDISTISIGIASSFISSLIAIHLLLKLVSSGNFNLFIIYRIILGILILIFKI